MPARLILVVALVAASLTALHGQISSPAGSALVMGRAVDGISGRPLGGVTVTLVTPSTSGVTPVRPTRVLTSADGYFVFRDVPHGSVTISAAKPGYVDGAYGKRSSTGTSLALDVAEGERRADLTIPIWKYAVMSGTVIDEAGDPMIRVLVRALRRSVVAGRWQLIEATSQPTDDRGVFRLSSLVPGEYVAVIVSVRATVSTAAQDAYIRALASGDSAASYAAGAAAASGQASSEGGVRVGSLMLVPNNSAPGGSLPVRPWGREDSPLFVYPTTFYPGSETSSDASVIALEPGEERSGVDFQLRPLGSVRVSGVVLGPDGPVARVGLQLVPAGANTERDYVYEAATSTSDASGRFTFLGVTSGAYTLRVVQPPVAPSPAQPASMSTIQLGSSTVVSVVPGALGPIPNGPTWWAEVPVSVGDRDVSTTVAVRSGSHVGGRVVFNGTAAKPTADALRRLAIMIEPSHGRVVERSPAGTDIRRAHMDADGVITSYGQPAGKYVVRALGAPPGWLFAGATLNGRDVTDRPLEVGGADVTDVVLTFVDRLADVNGTVPGAARAEDASATVLIFPADAEAWTDYGTVGRRFRSVSTGRNGSYRITALPEGQYDMIAVPDDIANWTDVSTLRKLAPLATRVTLSVSQATTQDLVVRTLP
ncbi:MAG: carboxypeptidase regulatory-like domain-containing protein [Acidobacteria bacterium]|nr:carboxypeptidase regulatory-like domain-containing protein [Acidobacteriota bacterium]